VWPFFVFSLQMFLVDKLNRDHGEKLAIIIPPKSTQLQFIIL